QSYLSGTKSIAITQPAQSPRGLRGARRLRRLRDRDALRAAQVRLRLAELAVQLVLIALAFDRTQLAAVGQRHVEAARIVLLLADGLDVGPLRPSRVDRDDEFVGIGHTPASAAPQGTIEFPSASENPACESHAGELLHECVDRGWLIADSGL